MANLAAVLQPRLGVQERLETRAIAEQQKTDLRMACLRLRRSRYDHVGRPIAPHAVQRDGHISAQAV